MDINLIMGYIIMGMVWVMILEYLSTLGQENETYGESVEAWTMIERIWNIIIWPITLMMMAHKLFEHINNNKDGENY
tara:strand:+ start:48 stop:278 length:231 start_codon:yes stop_codon:yes gene_type:complete